MKIITNGYHNTSTRTKYGPEAREAITHRIYSGTATDAEQQAMRRAKRTLCGTKGCTCSNDWGERS